MRATENQRFEDREAHLHEGHDALHRGWRVWRQPDCHPPEGRNARLYEKPFPFEDCH